MYKELLKKPADRSYLTDTLRHGAKKSVVRSSRPLE
jgi:hypothetical protein